MGDTPSPIEPLSIPFVVGNLGARTMIRLAEGKAPDRDPLLEALPRMKANGFTAVEDYVCWSLIEARQGEPDFRMYREHQRAARDAGLEYRIYPWLHSMPAWAFDDPDFAPLRCLEHDRQAPFPSIFAASTAVWMARFYALLAEGLGEVDAVTIAIPGDYGEVGYPSGMGCWAVDYPDAFDHCHPGYWCFDREAQQSFRRAMLQQYGSLAALNAAWQTEYASEHELVPVMPTEHASAIYRHDFLAFYRGAMTDFAGRTLDLAAQHFEGATTALKLGYGSELGAFGQDYTALIELAASRGAKIWSTHGTLPVHFHKRIQTPCRHLSVPYLVEGVTDRSREDVLDRLFQDAADGAQEFFEFHETFDQHESTFRENGHVLRGDSPRIDVALLFHTSMQKDDPRVGLPPGLVALATPLRDLLDFDIIDEDLLAKDGVLGSYGVLVIPDDSPLAQGTVERIATFTRDGGLVVRTSEVASADRLRFDSTASDYTELLFGFGTEWNQLGERIRLEPAQSYFEDARKDEACTGFGASAGCRLPIDSASSFRFELELFVPTTSDPALWRIEVDGDATDLRLRAGAQTLAFEIEAGEESRSVLTVSLHGPALPDGDARPLGLLLRRASLRRTATEATVPGDPWRLHARADAAPLREVLRPNGKGGTIEVASGDLPMFAAAILTASSQRSKLLPGASDFEQVDGERDGVRVAAFDDRLLVYNSNDFAVQKTLYQKGSELLLVALRARAIREFERSPKSP